MGIFVLALSFLMNLPVLLATLLNGFFYSVLASERKSVRPPTVVGLLSVTGNDGSGVPIALLATPSTLMNLLLGEFCCSSSRILSTDWVSTVFVSPIKYSYYRSVSS